MCFGLIKNHPWHRRKQTNGNFFDEKIFLRRNGFELKYELQKIYTKWSLAVESDAWKVDEIENWLRDKVENMDKLNCYFLKDEYCKKQKRKLKNYILFGIQTELTLAQEARNLASVIGNHSQIVNARGFGNLFARLQEIFSERETLCVAKIFDRPNRTYPSRNISSILNLIEENADLWSLPERNCLERVLMENGYNSCSEFSNRELALNIVSFYRNDMPSVDNKETHELSASLDAVFQSRDKVHAHNESISAEERVLPTCSDTQMLMEYAEDFIEIISLGFRVFGNSNV